MNQFGECGCDTLHEHVPVCGRVHSLQSLGAVDGPGLRSVVFLQGCPLRCAYCHNPDTWDFSGGTEMTVDALVEKLLRFWPYWGKNYGPGLRDGAAVSGAELPGGGVGVSGGVTVSGGEPLAQPEFVLRLFQKLHEHGVHTALDTSGTCDLSRAREILKETDLALVDLKFLTEEEYAAGCHGSLVQTEKFLELTREMNVPIWIRHVAVPGMTADEDYMKRVKQKAMSYPNLLKLEFLPFHNMCLEKYERMGIPFPLKDTPVMEQDSWKELLEKVL